MKIKYIDKIAAIGVPSSQTPEEARVYPEVPQSHGNSRPNELAIGVQPFGFTADSAKNMFTKDEE